MVGFNHSERAYLDLFAVYASSLESILTTHSKYPQALEEGLRKEIRKGHVQMIYQRYRGHLNDYLSLKGGKAEGNEADPDSRGFKYFANDIEKLLLEKLLK